MDKRTTLQLAAEKLTNLHKHCVQLEKELAIHNHYMRLMRNIRTGEDMLAMGENIEAYRLAKELEYMAFTVEREDTHHFACERNVNPSAACGCVRGYGETPAL